VPLRARPTPPPRGDEPAPAVTAGQAILRHRCRGSHTQSPSEAESSDHSSHDEPHELGGQMLASRRLRRGDPCGRASAQQGEREPGAAALQAHVLSCIPATPTQSRALTVLIPTRATASRPRSPAAPGRGGPRGGARTEETLRRRSSRWFRKPRGVARQCRVALVTCAPGQPVPS